MKNQDVYQMVTDRLIEALEAGTAPWRKPWNGEGCPAGWPTNLSTGKTYQGVNVWTLASAPFSSHYWVTFKQCQSLGGKVRKGEKAGGFVVYWNWLEKTDVETGKPVKIPFLKYSRVFNSEQCDGLEDKIPEPKALPESDAERMENAESTIRAYIDNGGPSFETGHQDRAFYRSSSDAVSVPILEQYETGGQYYSTVFHELTHSTGHSKRLDRGLDKLAAFGSESYSREELIAEMGAAFLCGIHGIDSTLDNSAAYLKGWIKALKSDSKMAVWAGSRAQKASNMILGDA